MARVISSACASAGLVWASSENVADPAPTKMCDQLDRTDEKDH
jgi:hypothetical protein